MESLPLAPGSFGAISNPKYSDLNHFRCGVPLLEPSASAVQELLTKFGLAVASFGFLRFTFISATDFMYQQTNLMPVYL